MSAIVTVIVVVVIIIIIIVMQPSQHHQQEAPDVGLKDKLIKIWQLKIAQYCPQQVLQPKKLCESLKLLYLHPGLYILMQKAVILNTCHIVRRFLVEQ